ncbi:MAG: hypothetical protein ACQEST_05505 [Bacteroidota bacterium]
MRLYLLLILVALLAAGCTKNEQLAPKTLSLSLTSQDGKFSVVDYEVRDNAFKKSQQQGRFQAHIFDQEEQILQKINVEKIALPDVGGENNQADYYFALPMLPEADRLEIYQLDGSSGHYQLKTDDPMLNWSIPKDIKGAMGKTHIKP